MTIANQERKQRLAAENRVQRMSMATDKAATNDTKNGNGTLTAVLAIVCVLAVAGVLYVLYRQGIFSASGSATPQADIAPSGVAATAASAAETDGLQGGNRFNPSFLRI